MTGRSSSPRVVAGGRPRCVLDGAEGRHAATVRRLRRRRAGRADRRRRAPRRRCVVEPVAGADRLDVRVDRVAPTSRRPTPRLVVVQALPKGDRGELAVETLDRGRRRRGRAVGGGALRGAVAGRARASKALERGGARPARRPSSPGGPGARGREPLADTARRRRAARRRARPASCCTRRPTRRWPRSPLPDRGDVVLVVGPEGGLSRRRAGRVRGRRAPPPYRLGPTVLRTSTAGTAAAAVAPGGAPAAGTDRRFAPSP